MGSGSGSGHMKDVSTCCNAKAIASPASEFTLSTFKAWPGSLTMEELL